jgi:hypothetical protein
MSNRPRRDYLIVAGFSAFASGFSFMLPNIEYVRVRHRREVMDRLWQRIFDRLSKIRD